MDRAEQDFALQERRIARYRYLLTTLVWMLDMCDRPPGIPGFLAPQINAELQEARRLTGSDPPPPWSCYVKEKS